MDAVCLQVVAHALGAAACRVTEHFEAAIKAVQLQHDESIRLPRLELSCGENHLLKVCRYFFHPTLQLLQQNHMIKGEEDARASTRQKRVGGEGLVLSL